MPLFVGLGGFTPSPNVVTSKVDVLITTQTDFEAFFRTNFKSVFLEIWCSESMSSADSEDI